MKDDDDDGRRDTRIMVCRNASVRAWKRCFFSFETRAHARA